MKFKISTDDAFGKAVASTINELTQDIREQTDAAVKSVARQAFEKLKEKAASKLYRTKDEYVMGLSFNKVGSGIYSIVLDASAAHLEEGYESYDMKPGLLHLGKEIPKGADGKDKIKVSKAGYRYRAIPFDQSQAPAKSNHPLHNVAVGTQGPALPDRLPSTTFGSLGKDLKAMIKATPGMTGISKNNQGTPIMGKVNTLTPHPTNNHALISTDAATGQQSTVYTGQKVDSRMMGLTKYQYEVKNRNGGTTMKSAYMTFRIVSEDPKYAHKWIHPGFTGIHAFKDVQRWAEDTLEKMVTEIIKDYR